MVTCFAAAGIVTFIRFFPEMKARYDYGLLILMLTFCLISVSGYRDDEVIHMAHKRVTTIIIGSITSVVICILICPVWIGEDLHKLVAGNLEKLGNFLEGIINLHITMFPQIYKLDRIYSYLRLLSQACAFYEIM